MYDPDLRDSPRRAAGAQVCTPGGGYLFRESQDVDAFAAAPHALALCMPMGRPNDAASSSAEVSEERFFFEYFEVSDDGRRHRGCLVASATREDESIWPSAKRVERVAWDFSVSVRAGFGANGDADSTHKSTAGWLSALPVFEPHYQILMAHGLATGHVTVDGEKTAFANAPAYAEKNWGGAGFPSKWFWTQCNAFPSAPGVSVTATGANRGVVLVPGMREEVAGILIHVPVAPGSNASGTDGETDEETGAGQRPRAVPVRPSAPAARSPRRSRARRAVGIVARLREDLHARVRGVVLHRPEGRSAWKHHRAPRARGRPPRAWSRAAASPSAAADGFALGTERPRVGSGAGAPCWTRWVRRRRGGGRGRAVG